jgi:hypothetical protein
MSNQPALWTPGIFEGSEVQINSNSTCRMLKKIAHISLQARMPSPRLQCNVCYGAFVNSTVSTDDSLSFPYSQDPLHLNSAHHVTVTWSLWTSLAFFKNIRANYLIKCGTSAYV